MADENVLREYLVSLGWKVDEAGKKRFDGALDNVAKTAATVAAGLTAAATAIAAVVLKIASSFDDLYFSAQRTNTSVASIKSLSYALSQLGADSSAAERAIGAVAQALRTNPAKEGLLQQLGVATRDAKGGLRDTVDILVDLDKVLEKQPYYIATQYAAQFGLDDATFNMIRGRAAEIKKFQEEYLKRAGELGVDPDKAAKAANELMTSFRQLQSEIGLVVDKIALDLGPTINKTLNDLQTWIAEHKDEIVDAVKTISKALVGVAEDIAAIVQNLQPLWDSFDGLAKAVTGKDGLQFALEAILAYTAGAWLIGMRGAVFGVQAAFIALVAYLSTRVHDEMQRVVGDALDKFNAAIGYQTPAGYDVQKERSLTTWDRVKNVWGWMTGKKTYDEAFKSSWSGGGRARPQSLSTAQEKANAAESFAFWKANGFTDEQAAGMVANEMHESRTNPRAVGDGGRAIGIFQHHPDRRARIQAGTGIDMSTATHLEQLKGALWELQNYEKRAMDAVLNAKTPEEAAAAFSMLFERPADAQGQARARAATAAKLLPQLQAARGPSAGSYKAFPPPLTAPPAPVTPQSPAEPGDWWSRDDWLNGKPMLPPGVTNSKSTTNNVSPNTTINIYGSSDPVSTGREVEKAQGRVNQNIIGNVTGAVQ